MRWALYLLGVGLVAMSASWSYKMTYRTQDAFAEVVDLRRDIAREREAITVLEAEWAWLNAPERLAALVKAHEDELGLSPMIPEHFARLDEIAEPPVDDGLEPVALIGMDEVGPVTLPNPVAAPAPRPRPVRVSEVAE
ncbi:MAG: cell division protein FtsL [Pseudomonadota bacterium]